MKGVGCRGGERGPVRAWRGWRGEGLRGGCRAHLAGGTRVGDEGHDGDGGGGPAWSRGAPGERAGWALGIWEAGVTGSTWPGPLPAWIEPHHQPCGLGGPCVLAPSPRQ